jgi:thiamine kinase-like enzyme
MADLNCPYCDAELEVNHDDGFGYEEGVKHEMECGKCGKSFVFQTSISFYYEPEVVEEKRNGLRENMVKKVEKINKAINQCEILLNGKAIIKNSDGEVNKFIETTKEKDKDDKIIKLIETLTLAKIKLIKKIEQQFPDYMEKIVVPAKIHLQHQEDIDKFMKGVSISWLKEQLTKFELMIDELDGEMIVEKLLEGKGANDGENSDS